MYAQAGHLLFGCGKVLILFSLRSFIDRGLDKEYLVIIPGYFFSFSSMLFVEK